MKIREEILRMSLLYFFRKYWIYPLLLIAVIQGCIQVDQDVLSSSCNSIWVESKYLRGYKPSTKAIVRAQDVVKFAKRMRRFGLKYLYVFAGPYGLDGNLPEFSISSTAKRNIELIRKVYPEAIILPWLGGIQDRTVKLQDSAWVRNAINSTKKLVKELRVEGVHIDFEYLLRGDPYLDRIVSKQITVDGKEYAKYVNAFHKDLRESLPHSFISSVVVSTSELAKHWKQQTSTADLKDLVSYVDQISFLFYDTQIDDPNIFKQAAFDLIQDISELQHLKPEVQFLVSIGTFINEPQLRKYRNLDIESIVNTLTVIKDVEKKVSKHQIINGISIYCDWETSNQEYKEFYQNWIEDRQ